MSSTNPVIHVRKYYFGYHVVNGIIFPFAWVEEDGLPVGGIPSPMVKWRISEAQFCDANFSFIKLEEEHPIPLEYHFSK